MFVDQALAQLSPTQYEISIRGIADELEVTCEEAQRLLVKAFFAHARDLNENGGSRA